jgi:hypothetical protein
MKMLSVLHRMVENEGRTAILGIGKQSVESWGTETGEKRPVCPRLPSVTPSEWTYAQRRLEYWTKRLEKKANIEKTSA